MTGAVAAWVSPVTTIAGLALMLALLSALTAREIARQRYADGRSRPMRRLGEHGPLLAPRSAAQPTILGVLLVVDVILRFGVLAHGR